MARSRRQKEEKKRKRLSARKRAEADGREYRNTTLAIPEGVEMFKPEPGVHRIDIIPYEAGEGNPFADPGDEYFERTYWIYRAIGADENSYCVPSGRDPVKEYRDKELKSSSDAYKALLPKKRQLWNVFDHGDPDKGVQLWDVSFHLFGKLLNSRIKNADEDEGFEYFADAEDGMTLKITVEEQSLGDRSYVEITAIDFKSRGELDKDLLDQAICLDELPIDIGYDELKRIFLQEEMNGSPGEDEEDEPEPEATSTRRRRRRQETESEEEEKPSTRRRRRRETEPEPEPETEEPEADHDDDWDDDWDDDEPEPDEEEEEEKPKRGRRGKAGSRR